MSPDTRGVLNALASLRRKPRSDAERCDLCGADLADEHPHLVESATRRLVCACGPCAILFEGQAGGKFRRVPLRVQSLPDFRMADEDWDGLHLPINLAFFLQSSAAKRVVAYYPSPAGATESLVELTTWQALADANPVLRELQPDVEALLVNRVGEARDHYRVGVDECYTLVGLIRRHWRGLSGGAAVWGEIARFFAGLTERSAHA